MFCCLLPLLAAVAINTDRRWNPNRLFCPSCLTLLVIAVSCCLPAAVQAGRPRVEFDVTYMVGCRDVTTDEFAEANPDERLVEARLQISSLIEDGSERGLIQYLYRIESPGKTVQVADYLPQTTLDSGVVGTLGIEQKREKVKSLGVTLSGQHDPLLRASGSGDLGSKAHNSVQYELLPPQELVAASGTIRRGSGVYFKLKPSPRSSLEGAKDFVLVLRVPRAWRADVVHVHCQAHGNRRGNLRPHDPPDVWGSGRFAVALYAEGDEAAKGVAERYVRAELQLRRTVAGQQQAIHRRTYPTVAHRVGVLLEIIEPSIPPGWLDHLLFALPGSDDSAIAEQLPEPVRSATLQFAEARWRLARLNGRHRQATAECAQ